MNTFSFTVKSGTKKYRRGFILPFTMLITTLVLFIMTGAMTLLSKQNYFSRVYKQGQIAYYAADDAAACAVAIDDTYIGDDGLGIFPSSDIPDTDGTDSFAYMNTVLTQLKNRDPAFAPIGSLTDIRCAQAVVFDVAGFSKFTVDADNYVYNFINASTLLPDTEEGKSISYFMKMDLGAEVYRCAKITVNKTQSFRQIIAQGYAGCDGSAASIERAVVNETVAQ